MSESPLIVSFLGYQAGATISNLGSKYSKKRRRVILKHNCNGVENNNNSGTMDEAGKQPGVQGIAAGRANEANSAL
jgi:hypothetical protein